MVFPARGHGGQGWRKSNRARLGQPWGAEGDGGERQWGETAGGRSPGSGETAGARAGTGPTYESLQSPGSGDTGSGRRHTAAGAGHQSALEDTAGFQSWRRRVPPARRLHRGHAATHREGCSGVKENTALTGHVLGWQPPPVGGGAGQLVSASTPQGTVRSLHAT